MIETISEFLREWSGYGLGDWLRGLADAATFGGIAVALLGGFVALQSYKAASSTAASQHVHGLFRDYLRLRLEVELREAPGVGGAAARGPGKAVLDQLAGAKLYALEEMFAWAQDQRRDVRWLDSRRTKRRKLDLACAWEANVVTHLLDRKAHVIDSLLGYTACYSEDFLNFAARHLRSEQVSAAASEASRAIDAGVERPLGTKERKQRGVGGPAS